ncbi:MAG: hypothetical protein QOE72_8 [Chloroflexota bacterium]|jgi:hypothetical protein|nr:hypothetical protein [Chloroflexota bacterium]
MRRSARWALIAAAVAMMLVVLAVPFGGRGAERASAAAPDVYQVVAGSSVVDTDLFQTGSPVDPSPLGNTAFPLTAVTADNQPRAGAHAAFVEPPASLQAAANINHVQLPYPTQAEALCANCSTPVTQGADGNLDQHIDGTRITLGAGHAHASATRLGATGDASNGVQTVGALDQLAGLYGGAITALYSSVIDRPGQTPPPAPLSSPPACQAVPRSVLSPDRQVCPAAPPPITLVAETGGSSSHSSVLTDDGGTVVDTLSSLTATRLLNGLISIATIGTEVRASGDGTAAGSRVDATNRIQGVCVKGDCQYSITATGICRAAAGVCANDPLNQALRSQGFNICRLGSSTARAGTRVVGDAQGILLEWHVLTRDGRNVPDPDYYRAFGDGACEPGLSTPHAGFTGTSFYVKLGRSEAQLFSDSFPAVGGGFTGLQSPVTGGTVTAPVSGATSAPAGAGLTGFGGSGGARHRQPPGTVEVSAGLDGVRDRRPLLLSVFGLLEAILLCNLTALALSRRP